MIKLLFTFISAAVAKKIADTAIEKHLVKNICKAIAKGIKNSCKLGKHHSDIEIDEENLNAKDLEKIIKKFEKLGYDIEVVKTKKTLTIKLKW